MGAILANPFALSDKYMNVEAKSFLRVLLMKSLFGNPIAV
jgi:hypothetical protein